MNTEWTQEMSDFFKDKVEKNIVDPIYSEILYEGLTENYGTDVIDAIIKNLKIDRSDLSLGDNVNIILKILNGK